MNFLEYLIQCSFDVVVYFLCKSAVWWLTWSHVLDTACFPFTKYNTYMYTPSVSELIQSCIQTSLYPLINPQLQSVLIYHNYYIDINAHIMKSSTCNLFNN